MKDKLRILHLEDSEDDSTIIHATLAREGIDSVLVRVETREDFIAAVAGGGIDLILADYYLPSFDGLAALKIAKERCPDVPFIFVSGAMGEEIAVETLRKGAVDYILKDRLSRLTAAIRRALLDVEEQAKRKQAEMELEKHRLHLEELVRDRTAALKEVNEELELELRERKKTEEVLYRREREFQALVENTPDVVHRFNRELRHVYINPAVEQMTGIPPGTFIHRKFRELGLPEESVSLWEDALRTVFDSGRETTIECEMPTRSGQGWIEARLVPEFSKDGSVESVLAISRDITDRKKLEDRLHKASITDELTGLLNRRGFLLFAQKQLDLSRRNRQDFSILYLDLDEMKRINDEFGHKEGDQALVDAAEILKKTFRSSDIIARIGGDEFTVLITEPRSSSVKESVYQHLQDGLRSHNEGTKRGYKLSLSMGMVSYDAQHPCTVEALLDRADELMYEHKQNRHRQVSMPTSMGGRVQRRTDERHEARGVRDAELLLAGGAMIRNISLSGISVRTAQRLTKDTAYRIRITCRNGEELSATAVVVWSSFIGKGSEEGDAEPYYEAGLRFTGQSEKLKNSLSDIVSSRARQDTLPPGPHTAKM